MSTEVNFCNEDFTTDIFSDRMCFDGHEATNLISRSLSTRMKGFLADHFVRPPVTLEMKFLCSIDLTKVKVGCCVGSQKSSRLELFTQLGSGTWYSVGSGVLKDQEKVFVWVIHGKEEDSERGTCVRTFKSSKFLYGIEGLRIVIRSTQGSSVPAIGELEVWGEPNRAVPKEISDHVRQVWRTTNPKRKEPPERTEMKKKIVALEKLGSEIPEEFIDPLTCEVMTIPMTLPSGNIIDLTSLERYKIAERKWGRRPSDPFTGLPFTQDRKPVVASALKARLDQFIVKNCDMVELKDIPRTVGTRLDAPGPSHSVSKPAGGSKSPVDRLVDMALEGLPSFLERPPPVQAPQCTKCSVPENLFKLDCTHLVCRTCLATMKSSQLPCFACEKTVDFSKVERYHAPTQPSL